jgi:hypothetical protein
MAYGHAAFCQGSDTTGNRFVIHIKKHAKHKTVYANVAGMVSGKIKKDSLLKMNKINMVDLQRRYKNLRVVSFSLIAERPDGSGKWYPIKQAQVFSLYHGNEFTDEMKGIIKSCTTGDKLEIYVTSIYFDGMKYGSLSIGYGGHVSLCML